ncbi:MAG: AmmeMemoRadiSam system protein B [Treponema sp.]|jgi:AmmeMemoRadiSam system protein B|nr:AmmeMemoRadiSam system protein B [Treponema sp.]
MILREPCLPSGWYPREKSKIEAFLEPFSGEPCALAAIAPHAGWYFSGEPAALAVSSLEKEAETIAVIGGHLPAGMPVLLAGEDGVKTPFGVMKIDRELREAFSKHAPVFRPDRYQDNTVEILLPMVRYFFPDAELLWLRFPAEPSSFDAGKLLSECAKSLGRRIRVIGSTDLTHYGRNYGFSPKGAGKAALEWVKKVNDAAFINAVLEGDPSRVLRRAAEDSSSCSAGAVLGAMGFAASEGAASVRLLDYRTSADADDEVPDSFVGYAAIAFDKGAGYG